jgi:hypothetical protein
MGYAVLRDDGEHERKASIDPAEVLATAYRHRRAEDNPEIHKRCRQTAKLLMRV